MPHLHEGVPMRLSFEQGFLEGDANTLVSQHPLGVLPHGTHRISCTLLPFLSVRCVCGIHCTTQYSVLCMRMRLVRQDVVRRQGGRGWMISKVLCIPSSVREKGITNCPIGPRPPPLLRFGGLETDRPGPRSLHCAVLTCCVKKKNGRLLCWPSARPFGERDVLTSAASSFISIPSFPTHPPLYRTRGKGAAGSRRTTVSGIGANL